MWKCKFCEKTNLDDQKVCPYCTAPNPAAQKPAAGTPEHRVHPQGSATPPVQDWASRYNPDPKVQKKPVKLDQVLKYMVIAVSALLIIYLATLLFQRPASTVDTAEPAHSDSSTAQAGKSLDAVTASTPEPTAAPTAMPEPTRAPVVVDAVTELYLDFGQAYQCSVKDFVLPQEIANDEITWICADNEAGTVCSKNGLIEAGSCQIDTEKRYNDEVIVTGTTEEGSVLYYHVFTGDGKTYTFDWSTSARTMRGSISGYVIVSDEMIVQSNGFSVYYEYELTKGKLDANAWSVWVREDGTTWVRVQDIHLENKVGEVFDITFDRPITFNEIWIMPETYSLEYNVSCAFQIGYLLFN